MLVGRPTDFILSYSSYENYTFMFYIKNRLNTGTDLVKLFALTVTLAVFSIPIATFNPAASVDNLAGALFITVLFELFFLIVFVMPLALGLMGLGYFTTRRNCEKKLENAGYGYIAGFLSGLLLLFLLFGIAPTEIAGLIGVALIGFCIGLALSFISRKSETIQSKSQDNEI